MFGHQLLLPIPDVDRTDFMLILGANPAVSNGSLMSAPGIAKRLTAIRERGGYPHRAISSSSRSFSAGSPMVIRTRRASRPPTRPRFVARLTTRTRVRASTDPRAGTPTRCRPPHAAGYTRCLAVYTATHWSWK
mgnify:CR=1 FL=1